MGGVLLAYIDQLEIKLKAEYQRGTADGAGYLWQYVVKELKARAESDSDKPEYALLESVLATQLKNLKVPWASETDYQRLESGLREVYGLLGYHTDDEAKADDPSPEDMAAHVHGLCRQIIRKVFPNV